MTVTPGHLARHYQGKAGQRDPAFLDIAQDHALKVLHDRGIFKAAVFKGGTALRKFRAGNDGRFSTDLDFACASPMLADQIFDALDGRELGGFSFALTVTEAHRRASLSVRNDSLGPAPQIPAQVEISTRSIWLPSEALPLISLPIHKQYGFVVPATPVISLEEMIAEKLARYRRHPLVRDLYDLAWCAKQPFDEGLVRRLSVLKVWHDVVVDRRGDPPFDPSAIVQPRGPRDFGPEAIGYLTRTIDVPGWIDAVRTRYAFIVQLSPEEREVARCNFTDRDLVNEMILDLRP